MPERELAGASMRAAVVTGAGQVRIDDVTMPEPGPGEVRVRVKGCGVCASNLGPWAGPPWMKFPTPPGALGHEGWGVVDAVGRGVKGLAEGDPVVTLFQNSYAQYDVGDASSVVVLPSALADAPFPGEPLGCAMNILERSDLRPGQEVAIIGVGFLGALLTRLAVQAGTRVTAISRRSHSLELATRMGAHETVRIDDAKGAMQGRLFERVIEAAGKQEPLDLAAELTAERGRLVIAGYHQDGSRQVNMQLWNWRGIDVINAHERSPSAYVDGTRRAVEAVLDGRIELFSLLTHCFALDELGSALDMTRDRPDGFVKAWVTT
jgi:threonine dehydrogenase-like Zn-dependent dehydrogenase